MPRKTSLCLSICIAALGVATLGFAGIPDHDNSSCVMLNAPPATNLSICNVPDGSGYTMMEARQVTTIPGTWEDATITVTLLDNGSNPVNDYPYEDIWLENPPFVPPGTVWDTPGLVACPGGAVADANTDPSGVTTFSGPFFAGGHAEYSDDGDDGNDGKTYVMVGGLPLNNGPLLLLHNSPDINGDGMVNTATDVVIFSTWYSAASGYHYGVDFYFDEVNDISDLVLFSAAQNVTCP